MFANVRALFCKWTPWELQIMARLSDAIAEKHRLTLHAQKDAVTKIQRIVGWTEIDLYVMKQRRVCWDGVPCFEDQTEFRLAIAKSFFDNITVKSELFCIKGHLFSIESDSPIKPYAFRREVQIQIEDVDTRFT